MSKEIEKMPNKTDTSSMKKQDSVSGSSKTIINANVKQPGRKESKKKKGRKNPKQGTISPSKNSEEYSELSYLFSNDTPVKESPDTSGAGKDPCEKKPSRRREKNFKAKYKTERCKFWEVNGECKFGENCAFAHGCEDIRNRRLGSSYKTKKCKQFYENGYCPYGTRCQFIHNGLITDVFPKVSYYKLISSLSHSDNVNYNSFNRPRLKTFESIAKTGQGEESRLKLFEDIISLQRECKEVPLFNRNEENNNHPASTNRSRFMSA